jgi:hypothetical protein
MSAEAPSSCVVQLRYAALPWGIGLVADHYWFVVTDEGSGSCQRWEVWQSPDAGGVSVGHVHRDLKDPDADVGGGPTRIAAVWHGAEAAALRAVLERCAAEYPHCHLYHYWPGPNSNTFAAWVLRKAGIDYALPWRAIGATFLSDE